MKRPFAFFARAAALAPVVVFSVACISNHEYDVEKLEDIDAHITLFNDGITLPVGQTEQIKIGTLLDSSAIGGLDSLLVVDPKTGDYSITSQGDYNLDKVIEDMHLEKLRSIDGSYFSKDIEYVIGDIDPTQFVIEGKQFDYESEQFPIFNLDDIKVPEITVPDQKINTGLYKYMPSDLDVGKKVGNIENSQKIIAVNDIKAITDQLPGPADYEMSVDQILSTLGIDDFKIEAYQKSVDESLSLGENASQIADIKDFVLKNGSAIKITLEAENVPLLSGTVTPNILLDMSDIFVLADANPVTGKVSLASMTMNSGNNWKSEKSFSISSLAGGFPTYSNGKLSLKGLVNLEGSVKTTSATSTKNKINSLAGKDMKVKVLVSCDGIVLETMEVTLGDVSYKADDVEITVDVPSYSLPDGIKTVKKIYLDQTKKFEVNISANGLSTLKSADGSKHISVKPEIVVTIPEGLEVAEAVNNKIVIKDADLYDGPISTSFTLVSLTPTITGKSLTYNGKITATIQAKASGTVSSKYLPTTAANDVVITTKMGCKPKLSDYDVTLDPDKIIQSISESREFSFELEGMGDFGTFKVNLQGNPSATLSFNMPQSTEVQFVADNLVIALPKMMVIDGKDLPGTFDQVKNSLTLNGAIPAEIVMPIKYLEVVPEPGQGGKTKVTGTYSINGKVGISKYEITRKTFDELSGKKVKVQATIPSMKATSIALEGDFSKSLDYDIKDVVILDAQTIADLPKEVKYLDKIDMNGVNALIELKVEGLPDLEGDFYLQNTRITLPPFIIGEGGTNELVLDDKIKVQNNETIKQVVGLSNLKDVQLSGITELKGDFLLRSKLTSHCPVVDVATLKGKITAHCNVGVGNGTKATVPGKIVIDKAQVKVGYDYEQVEAISFGEIPAELQADTVNFGLNPNMYVDLTTNFGAPVKGDFEITPYIGGKALTEDAVLVSGIELPYSEDWNKTLTNKYAIGQNPSAEPGVTVIHANLASLVKRIPDSIKVAIKVVVDQSKSCVIFPEAAYNCSMSYKFDVPVSFSNEFKINLNPTVDVNVNINEALKLAVASLTGNIYTTLPLGAECNIKLLDANDKEIALNKPCTLKIQPSPDGVRVSEQSFELIIDIKDRDNLEAKKILFEISLKTSPDVTLNKDQYIQIKDIKITLPNGVSLNLKEE